MILLKTLITTVRKYHHRQHQHHQQCVVQKLPQSRGAVGSVPDTVQRLCQNRLYLYYSNEALNGSLDCYRLF